MLGGAGCERAEKEPPRVSGPPAAAQLDIHQAEERHAWKLPPGQTRNHTFSLEAGQYLHLIVEQRGLDVITKIEDSTGNLLLQVDSPNFDQGSENLPLVAAASGQFTLGVKADKGTGGYVIRVDALRPATEKDQKRASAAAVYSSARLLEKKGAAREEVVQGYRNAAQLWNELGDAYGEAWALFRIGKLYVVDDTHRQETFGIFTRALDLFQQIRDEHHQAIVLGHLGSIWEEMHDPEQAALCYEQALVLWKKLGKGDELATHMNDLALVRVGQRKFHTAINLYSQAIDIWQRLGHWRKQATARTNLGRVYDRLNEFHLAVDQYRRALALLDRLPNPKEREIVEQRAVTLNKLGDVVLRTDGPEPALKLLRESLELRRQVHDTRGEAVTLNSISLAQLRANRPREALREFGAARDIFRRQGDRLSEAVSLNNLGIAYERLNHPERAREHFENALALAREYSYSQVEEVALFGLARVARLQSRLDEAERWMEQTLEKVEGARSQVWRPDLRSSFHAQRQEHYGFLIDLLAERHRREPGRGYDAKAFAASERARARSLLDLLSTATSSPEPEELRRLDDLSQRLNERHLAVLAASPQSIPVDLLERELVESLEKWRQESADAQGPPTAVPVNLSLDEVQKRLLDEEALLLEYFLGEERSYLWAVTSSTSRFVTTLPGRAQIEEAAWQAYERMIESHHQTEEISARQAAQRLSRMILGPVSDLLKRRRLIIVGHGTLQAVPFAALPRPDAVEPDASPLIVDHEIVTLPSISVLDKLRSGLSDRRSYDGPLAILSDPVFGSDDERLQARRRRGGPAPTAWSRQPILRRLPYTAVEAKAILSLIGPGRVLAVSGFKASRDLVLSGQASGYRILHLATHGLFNDRYPDLSALVLSGFDASGRPVDGFLRAYEISRLDLRCDLVVLSACRTGQVKGVGGEGLVGLTQGFLHAGAPRLVVSLWNVSDHSTSELMTRFYVALQRDGLPPAQALRKAQISLWKEHRWRAPYHWAGFVFHGDWQ